jgi:iron complex outermembrane receptor protein
VLLAAGQDRPGGLEAASVSSHSVDAGLSYRLALAGASEAMLFLRGSNLTDQEVRNSASFLRDFAPEPGRSFETGVRLMF